MTLISGFTFIHNAIDGGLPIVEAIRAVQPYVDEVVVVDMQSTDRTREVLEWLEVRIVDGRWGGEAGETLREAHSQHKKCKGDVIVHFEADEVFDDGLIEKVKANVLSGITDIAVYRLQIEQNFQRVRWYPEVVHRVFPNHSGTFKDGHTTNRHGLAHIMSVENGFLWDCTNIFRDNWFKRVKTQAELWGEEPQYRVVPLHCLHEVELTEGQVKLRLEDNHWTWRKTPLNIPDILKPLLGMTKYEPRIREEEWR